MYIRFVIGLLCCICVLQSVPATESSEGTEATEATEDSENTEAPQNEEETTKSASESTGLEDGDTMALVQKLIENIKKDSTNLSYDQMIRDKVMNEHTLNNHKSGAPYFYSNSRYVITDIIELVLDDPDGVIDETKTTGQLKIYRESVYADEIEHFFDQEKRVTKKVQNPKLDFHNNFLGQTITGPTNKVVVALYIKGDERNLDTLEKRLTYIKNNIRYIDAYPVKGSVPVSKPTSAESKEPNTTEEETEDSNTKPEKSETKTTKDEEGEEAESEESNNEVKDIKKTDPKADNSSEEE